MDYVCRFMLLTILFGVLINVFFDYIKQVDFLIRSNNSYSNVRALKNFSGVTSVWCKKDDLDGNHRTCLFKNLCWLPAEQQLVFLLGDESILSGVQSRKDLSSLDFSPVEGHNRFPLKLAIITIPLAEQNPLTQFLVYEENDWVYFMWRFKPDNIMHVLHDDLLPLYEAYEEICGGDVKSCANKYKLIFVDDLWSNISYDLYEVFSNERANIVGKEDGRPLFLKKKWRNYSNSIVCFSHARVGLPRTTLWFQYGFGKPQGAIENSKLSMALMKKFGHFLMDQMGISVPSENKGLDKSIATSPRAVYISRSITRRIVNELDVIDATKKVYFKTMGTRIPLQVDFFNPTPNITSGIKEMLKSLSKWPPPLLIFGMHGAALTVASFLSLATKNSSYPLAILELFPLGIDPDAVSPIRALTKLPWLKSSNHVIYDSWTNKDQSKSITPSVNTDPLQGGGNICKGLKLNSVLPPVHCCHNREYLCRMFQDTVVNYENIYSEKLQSLFLLQEKMKDQNAENFLESNWYFPAPVTNIQCSWNMTTKCENLKLSWVEPINLFNHLYYYVVAIILTTDVEANHASEFSFTNLNSSNSGTKDYFMKASYPEVDVTIPQDLLEKSSKALKADVWVHSVVTFDHMNIIKFYKSLDTHKECSISLKENH